jgi:hypothetical protein
MSAGMTAAAVLWVTAGSSLPRSLRRLHPGSFLITPRGSRRAAAFRVSACFGYPATGAGEGSVRLRRAAA